MLLNIAEDVQIERKMVKKKITSYLGAALGRTNAELLILTVTFLKKLSIFEENKDRMADDVVPHLVKFIPCNNKQLMQVTLRLLLNLSFDATLRDVMVKNGIQISLGGDGFSFYLGLHCR